MSVRRILIAAVLLAVLALSLVIVAGCPQKPPETTTTVTPPPPPPPAEAKPATETAAPSAFKWTEKPALADIPAGTIKGMLNGKPFEAKTVRIKKTDEGMRLEIVDQAGEKATDMFTGETSADLYFADIAEGKSGELVLGIPDKKADKQDATYMYPQGGDKGPMTENPDWGCALQITDFKMEKDPQDDKVLGHVKGKVAIVFNDDAKSWVAGDLDGVYYKW